MALTSVSQSENANTANQNKQISFLKHHMFTMLAAFSGVVLGVLGSMGFVASYMHTELANQTASLTHVINARNADVLQSDTLGSTPTQSGAVCGVPAGGSGAGVVPSVSTAAAVTPSTSTTVPAGGMGAGPQGPGNTTNSSFTKKLVGGVFATETATISNTGPQSSNSVKFENTSVTKVDNDNTVSVKNVNPQTANSGDANVSDNTYGGNAATGTASNNSDTSTGVTINN